MRISWPGCETPMDAFFERGTLTLVSDRAVAPGTPVTLDAGAASSGFSFQGKSLGSVRRPDGSFQVRVRPLNLRREHRKLLELELSR